MRRILASAALLAIALPAAAEAQRTERGPVGQRGPAERIIQLRQELNLSADQVARIEQIRTQLRQQNEPLLQQVRQHREAQRAERQQLTPEQREQMRAQMRERMTEARKQREQRTPEQREQMRQRMEQFRNATPEQRRQLREQMQREGVLPPRAFGPRGPAFAARVPAELQPVMQQIRQNTQNAAEQVRGVLTPEQQQKLRELRPAQRRGEARGARRGPGGQRGAAPGR